jgi:hypothetical protein
MKWVETKIDSLVAGEVDQEPRSRRAPPDRRRRGLVEDQHLGECTIATGQREALADAERQRLGERVGVLAQVEA